jgi:hypothetical protein
MWLKIAIVPGWTPLLLQNTLLRAMGAVIDTSNSVIHATKFSRTNPIQLTEKRFFLLGLNDLVDATVSQQAAEIHQVSEVSKVCHHENASPMPITSQSNIHVTHIIPPDIESPLSSPHAQPPRSINQSGVHASC